MIQALDAAKKTASIFEKGERPSVRRCAPAAPKPVEIRENGARGALGLSVPTLDVSDTRSLHEEILSSVHNRCPILTV